VRSPESALHMPTGKLGMPPMTGFDQGSTTGGLQSNPFSGIRRAGQAKRAMNFEKFQQSNAGAQNQNQGGQAKTLFGSMQQKPTYA
jgi:hypothetical protein